MKKLLSCILTAILILAFSSCSSSTLKNEWFSDEILEKCAISELPEISDTIGTVTVVNDERIRLTYGYLTIIYDDN